jgi:hypothetical protein
LTEEYLKEIAKLLVNTASQRIYELEKEKAADIAVSAAAK